MKNKLTFQILALFGLILVSSCSKDDSSDVPPSGSEHKFLLLNYSDADRLEAGATISLLEIRNGEPVINTLDAIYPDNSLSRNVEIRNNRVVMGLHNNFNTDGTNRQRVGVWFDPASFSRNVLPLLPSGNDRYAYFDVSSGKVSKSGHVFYLSSSNDSWYHDQYRAILVRYNPSTGALDQAPHPGEFAVNQPERGWDTETGQFKGALYPSDDGRYVYGAISTFGVDGGVIHWDYSILFKYDFELNKYTRLGDAPDSDVNVYGINSNGTELYYSSSMGSGSQRKIVNTATNTTRNVTISGGQNYSNTSRWNSNGYCSGESNNTIGVYNLVSDSKEDIRTPSMPYHAQFSPGGDAIYFMMKSSQGNYLCKTSNLTATATIDTVATLSSKVNEFMIMK